MEDDRYTALSRIRGWDQHAIRQSTVMVVGVGALGNEVAKNLALLGVGRIVLIDFDHVAISDLSRSVLFRRADHGLPKAEVAARAVREINPEIQVLGLCADATRAIGLGMYRRMSAVLGCMDSIAGRYYLNRCCWRANVPWVEGGMAEHIGVVKAFQPPDSACYECTMSAEDRAALSPKRASCSAPPDLAARPSIPTTPLIAAATGALMVQRLLELLRGDPIGGNGWHLNLATGETLTLRFQRRPACLSHGETIDRPIEALPVSAHAFTLGAFLERAAVDLGADVQLELGRSIVTSLMCPACGTRESVWLDRDDLVEEQRSCPACGTRRQPEYTQSLGLDTPWLDRPLSALGIPPLDVLTAANGDQYRFFELTGDVETCMRWM